MIGISGKKSKYAWLLSPWCIAVSVVIGVMLGMMYKDGATVYKLIGHSFLGLLTMCVVPLLIAAVSTSVAEFIRQHKKVSLLFYMFLAIGFILVVCAILGITAGTIMHVDSSSTGTARNAVGRLLMDSQNTTGVSHDSGHALVTLFGSIVPSNLFYAMAKNKCLALLTFSVLFGVVIGYTDSKSSNHVYQLLKGTFDLFMNLISGVIYLLPVGLIAIISDQIASTGTELFASLGGLMLFMYGGCLVICFVFIIVLAFLSGKSIVYTIKNLRTVMLVAFISSSSFTSFPYAIQALEERFSIYRERTRLFLPINVCFSSPGSVFVNSLFVIYLVMLYGIKLTLINYLVIVFGCVLESVAGSGLPVIASVSMLAVVLSPLGIPVNTAVILMVAIANFVDPILTVANVLGNCMMSLVFDRFINKVSLTEKAAREGQVENIKMTHSSSDDGIKVAPRSTSAMD